MATKKAVPASNEIKFEAAIFNFSRAWNPCSSIALKPNQATILPLDCILVYIEETNCTFTASNGSLYVQTKLEIGSLEKGEKQVFLVKSHLVQALINQLGKNPFSPGEDGKPKITVSLNGNLKNEDEPQIKVSTPSGEYRLQVSTETKNFPTPLSLDGHGAIAEWSVPLALFQELIRGCMYATAKGFVTFYGIHLLFKDEVLKVAATDSKRAGGFLSVPAPAAPDAGILLTPEFFGTVASLPLNSQDEILHLRWSKDRIEALTTNITICGFLAQGFFPEKAYEILAQEAPKIVEFNKAEMLAALNCVALFSEYVELRGDRDKPITIQSKSDYGESTRTLPNAIVTADSFKVLLNSRFFMEAVKAMRTQQISLESENQQTKSPLPIYLVATGEKSLSQKAVIMPLENSHQSTVNSDDC